MKRLLILAFVSAVLGVAGDWQQRQEFNLCELEVVIPPAEYPKMVQVVEYTLHAVNSKKEYEWQVREGVKLTWP